jgi:hypothetical protein
MVDVPFATPVTTPLPDPIVAIDVLLLLQAPPGAALLNDVVEPVHTVIVPVIGKLDTVTILVAAVPQPVV